MKDRVTKVVNGILQIKEFVHLEREELSRRMKAVLADEPIPEKLKTMTNGSGAES